MSEGRVRLVPIDHDPFGEPPAAAPARTGLIGNRDLGELLPVQSRRVGPYKPGFGTYPVAGGEDWLDIDPNKLGTGLHMPREQLQEAWDRARETISNWSPEQRAATEKYFADHPETGPGSFEEWDRATKLPLAARYWYELSGRGIGGQTPEESPEHRRLTFNVISATSPSAEPEPNFRRALGIMAEHVQGLPLATDILSPGLVRKLAFAPEDPDAPKTGNFADTMAHIEGLVDRAPISVNDRQIAERHGIDRVFLGKTPWMYGLLAHFYQNFRDAENAADPAIRGGEDNPYEAWQLQAPSWVDTRNQKTGASGTERNDDYLQVIGRLKPELEAAGIDTSPGLLSRAVLSDPRLPDLMSTTRQHYLESPMMTLETKSTMHPEGRAAEELFNQLPPAVRWADLARQKYESIQRRSMRALANTGGGKFPSVLGNMVTALTGEKSTLPRVDTTAWGSYGGTTNPNMRVPMWQVRPGGERRPLRPDEINTMLGGLGHAFYQEAVPASRFRTLSPQEEAVGQLPNTHSVFLDEAGRPQTPLEQIDAFGRLIHPYPINVARSPNGTLLDINVADQPSGPAWQAVAEAANQAFPDTPFRIIGKNYNAHYMMHPDTIEDPMVRADPTASYDAAHDTFWENQRALDQVPSVDDTGRVRKTYGDAARRLGDYTAAVTQAREIADTQRAASQQWHDETRPRLDAWLARTSGPQPPLTPAAPLGPGYGALSNPAQAAQPPPANLVPVDHDPFAAAAPG